MKKIFLIGIFLISFESLSLKELTLEEEFEKWIKEKESISLESEFKIWETKEFLDREIKKNLEKE